ncbi:MAG: T9SS type A sorting domain-containing protein, partial [Ignavibacteriae bacterium]|nr:T9SS type A sorting domain-containing protein [Ignavibacteriota bacterium]
ITITDDGSVIFFIDSENYIRIIASDGTEEQVISNDNVWNSVSLSPDGTKLAATTHLEDGLIYVFDLVNSNNSKAIKLYNPTTQEGIQDSVVKYADALDWNLSSEFIVYDSFNQIPQATGGSFDYWDVNILDVVNDKIYSLFPPQADGISIGNPSFGQTNDNYLLIDKIDFNNATDTIFAVDLFSGDVGLVEANGSSIGFPRYSPNDEQVVFQKFDEADLSNLRQIAMAENKISSSSESYSYVSGGQSPAWFAIGTRPVSVEEENNNVISDYHLYQNYPNPFNPTTTIKYSIPNHETNSNSSVQLRIYDMLGKEVVTLVNSKKQSGNYYVNFNAENLSSGIYYYQLVVNDFVETKKMVVVK